MRFRSRKMTRLAPIWRKSAMTSPTGFCSGRVPQAAGTTQNSHWKMQPRVASMVSLTFTMPRL